jgi:hypothetical protein
MCSYLSSEGGRSQRADTSPPPLHPLLFPFFSSSFLLVRVRQRRRCWAVVPGHPGRGHRPCLYWCYKKGSPPSSLPPRWCPPPSRAHPTTVTVRRPSLKSTTLGQLLDPKPLLRSCLCRPLICANMYVYCVAPTRGCLCCRRLNGRRCGLPLLCIPHCWHQCFHTLNVFDEMGTRYVTTHPGKYRTTT